MQKKILLKTTREYLQNNFPENLLPARKLRQKKKKLLFAKVRNLKIQVIKAKKQVFNQYASSIKKIFSSQNWSLNKSFFFYNPKSISDFQGIDIKKNIKGFNFFKQKSSTPFFFSQEPKQYAQTLSTPPFLFSTNQIQYELSKKKTRSSDFKNQLKERKKLALIYGQLSKKYIKKTLNQASKLNGKKYDNFFCLLESRLDVVLFKASFFSSIKTARQYINHNKILVNNQIINICSYKLKAGDIISVKPKHKILLYNQITFLLKKNLFKQKTIIFKQFLISKLILKNLKTTFKSLSDIKFLVNNLKKNSKAMGDSSKVVTKSDNQKNKKNFNTNTDFIVKYKQLLSQLKQVIGGLITPRLFLQSKASYSKKNEYLNNSKFFSSNLNQTEKNSLIANLIQLDLLEKNNTESLEGSRFFLIYLKLKKLFFRTQQKKKIFTILNQNVLKPLNLEISYKNLVIIYLYPPQKISFACSIDMELISRSLA